MPNNFNKANIKAFMGRVFTPRNILVTGLGTVVIFLFWHDLDDNDNSCSGNMNQKQDYKTELAAARDSLLNAQYINIQLKDALDNCRGDVMLRDSIAVLNQKLDDCRGKKKAVVKSTANSTTVKRTSTNSTTAVSTSAKQSGAKGEGLINFYDNSSNQAGGIIINVYDCNGNVKANVVPAQAKDASANVAAKQNVSNQTPTAAPTAAATAGVKKAAQGREVLITTITSEEIRRSR